MGKLMYADIVGGVDLDDRLLAHLRVVTMNKLRRGEPFMLTFPAADGIVTRSLWVHPAMSLTFHFYGSRPPALDSNLIERMMQAASSTEGLVLDKRGSAPGL